MDRKIPDGVVLTAAYALSREWNLHYPDAVRMAALVLSVGRQHPEWQSVGVEKVKKALERLDRTIEACAELTRLLGDGQPHSDLISTAGGQAALAKEAIQRALSQQPAAERVDVRKLVALAERWERYADGCRPYGFIKEAELLEHCAQCIRQALGISADAGESSLILPGRDPLVEKLLSIAIKDKEKERASARAGQPDTHGGVDAPGSREWMAEVCRAAALSLAAHGVWNDQLLKVADWITQQGGEVT